MFTYKSGNSLLHKTPAWVKLIIIPFLNIVVFLTPWQAVLTLVILQFIAGFLLAFSFKEQVSDVKPVIFYAVILFSFRFITMGVQEFAVSKLIDLNFIKNLFIKTFDDKEILMLLLKLFCVMQGASLLFRTSTSLQLREGLASIEHSIRKVLPVSKKNKISNTVSMFVCFIPMVNELWLQSKKAWFARGGKRGIKMYKNLLTVIFSVGMKKAYNTARAVAIRDE